MTRVVGFVVRNWPLKLAAIVLASLLYAGLVLSQNARTADVSVPINALNQPKNTALLSDLGTVDQITYVTSDGFNLRPTSSSFRATVDLSRVDVSGGRATVPVELQSDGSGDIRIIDYQPRRIDIQLDAFVTKSVGVTVDQGPTPTGLVTGKATIDPQNVQISGPSSLVARVVTVRASVVVEPSGLNVDRDVQLVPIDGLGDRVAGVEVQPVTAHVAIPVFTNLNTRTLPVEANVEGNPGAGFAVGSIDVQPQTVLIEGEAEQLANLDHVTTEAIFIGGATSDVSRDVALALPGNVTLVGRSTVRVTVRLRPATETRTLVAGVQLDGAQGDLTYVPSVDRVLLTVFGTTAGLDRLGSEPLAVHLDVAGLGPGTHAVKPSATLPSGLQLVSVAPTSVSVTVAAPPTPAPAASADSGATAAPSP